MANYSLVVGSKFQPFSFERYIQPYQIYGQNYRELEDQYGELATKASVWEEMANEQTDPYAYKMYKTYANDLEKQAAQLAREGLNINSRKSLLDMRRRYNKEITPIEQAYTKREALSKEQREMLQKNPTMLYERMANSMSLDDFIKNPQADYGQSYSGALITQQVATAAANIAKEARDSEEGKRKLRRILPFQYDIVEQNGFSREAVMKAILGSPDADRILTGIVDDAINTSGVNNWGDAITRARALDYARQGLYSAIGETKHQIITDQAGLAKYNSELSLRNAKELERYKKSLEVPTSTGLNDRRWEGSIESDPEKAKSISNTINKIASSKYGKGHGLNTKYSGKNFKNPMAIYEEVQEYAKRHPLKVKSSMSTSFGIKYVDIDNSYSNALKVIKNKYGVSDVISKSDYDNLRELGYNSTSTYADFAGDNLQKKYNTLSTNYRPTSINSADVSYPDDVIRGSISADSDTKGKLYRKDKNGLRGNEVEYGDIFKKDDKEVPISDIAYSMREPNFLLIRTPNGDFYISPDYYSSELAAVIRGNRNNIGAANAFKDATLDQKIVIQDAVASEMEAIFNSYRKTRSKTDSKR